MAPQLSSFEIVPKEIFDHIVSHIDLKGLLNVFKSSRTMQYRAANMSNRSWFDRYKELPETTEKTAISPETYNSEYDYKWLVQRTVKRGAAVARCDFCTGDNAKKFDLVLDVEYRGPAIHSVTCCLECWGYIFIDLDSLTELPGSGPVKVRHAQGHCGIPLMQHQSAVVYRVTKRFGGYTRQRAIEFSESSNPQLDSEWIHQSDWKALRAKCYETHNSCDTCTRAQIFNEELSDDEYADYTLASVGVVKKTLIRYLIAIFKTEYTMIARHLIDSQAFQLDCKTDGTLMNKWVTKILLRLIDKTLANEDYDISNAKLLEISQGMLQTIFGYGDGTPFRVHNLKCDDYAIELIDKWFNGIVSPKQQSLLSMATETHCCYCNGRGLASADKRYTEDDIVLHLFEEHVQEVDGGWRVVNPGKPTLFEEGLISSSAGNRMDVGEATGEDFAGKLEGLVI